MIVLDQEAGEATATLTIPVGRSIQQQLLDFHVVNRGASLESVLSRVRVRRITADTGTCFSLRARVAELSALSVPVPPADVMALHPVVHRFVVNIGTGRIDATLTDPEFPIVSWAIATANAIQQCGAGG